MADQPSAVLQSDFSGGVISDGVEGRVDLDLYGSSLRRGQNVLFRQTGTVRAREGTKDLGVPARATPDQEVKYVPFIVSEDDSYLTVFYDNLMHVFAGGEAIQPEGGTTSVTAATNTFPAAVLTLDSPSGDVGHHITPGTPIKLSGFSGGTWASGVPDGWYHAYPKYQTTAYTTASVTNHRNCQFTTTAPIPAADYVCTLAYSGTVDKWEAVSSITGTTAAPRFTFTVPGGADTTVDPVTLFWQGTGEPLDSSWYGSPGGVLSLRLLEPKQIRLYDTSGTPIDSVGFGAFSAGTVDEIQYTIWSPYTLEQVKASQSAQDKTRRFFVQQEQAPWTLYQNSSDSWAFVPARLYGDAKPPTGVTVTPTTGGDQYLVRYRLVHEYTLPEDGDKLVRSFGTQVDVRIDASVGPNGDPITLAWDAGDYIKTLIYRFESGSYLLLDTSGGAGTGVGITSWLDNTGYGSTVPPGESRDTIREAFNYCEEPTENATTVADDYPSAVALSDQRLALSGSVAEPDRIYLSETGILSNFSADDAVTSASPFDVIADTPQDRGVRAMVGLNDLIAFTKGAEVRVGSGEQAFNNDNVSVKNQSYHGTVSAPAPLLAEDTAIFVQEKGNVIRDFRYKADGLAGASYGSRELSLLANDLLEGRSIVSWAYADEPEATVWAVMSDGSAVSFTFSREHNVVAFSEHSTGKFDQFKDVVVVPEAGGNGIYFLVQRHYGEDLTIAIMPTEYRLEKLHTTKDSDHTFDQVNLDAFVKTVTPELTITGGSIKVGDVYRLLISGTAGEHDGKIVDVIFKDPAPHPQARYTERASLGGCVGQFRLSHTSSTSYWVQELVDAVWTDINPSAKGWDQSSLFDAVAELRVFETTTSLTGLDDYEDVVGVNILADGEEIVGAGADISSGAYTLTNPASHIYVGRSFEQIAETLPPFGDGAVTQMNTQKFRSVGLQVVRSSYIGVVQGTRSFDPGSENLYYWSFTDEDSARAYELWSGRAFIEGDFNWSNEASIMLYSASCKPWEVAMITADLNIGRGA